MANLPAKSELPISVSREDLIELLNEDLSREYQAIIAYVVYSQVLKGAQYMKIAAELELHAGEELAARADRSPSRSITSAACRRSTPKPVKTSEKAEDMLRFDLDNENETIRNYRERVRQCEALGEYAMAEQIRADPGAGAGTPDRPGHRAGHRRSRRRSPLRIIEERFKQISLQANKELYDEQRRPSNLGPVRELQMVANRARRQGGAFDGRLLHRRETATVPTSRERQQRLQSLYGRKTGSRQRLE